MVYAECLTIGVRPDDFLVTRDFEHFGSVGIRSPGGITGDDKVSVGQDLAAAWILQPRPGQVFVVQLPVDFSVGVKIDDAIAMRTTNQCFAIGVTNRSERPRVNRVLGVVGNRRIQFADDHALVVVMENSKVQKMRG